MVLAFRVNYVEGDIVYSYESDFDLLLVSPSWNHAREDFDYWFGSANSFLIDFQHAFDRNDTNKAAFELHQATERLFHAIILTFTGYKPKLHDLEKLDPQASDLHPEFFKLFPRATEEQRHHFKLLKEAYIEARLSVGQIKMGRTLASSAALPLATGSPITVPVLLRTALEAQALKFHLSQIAWSSRKGNSSTIPLRLRIIASLLADDFFAHP